MSRELPEYNQLMRYTINDVCNWLAENKFGEFVKMFRENGIDGNRFVTLQDTDFSKMGCPMNKRRDLLKLIKELPKPTEQRVKNIVQPSLPATPTRDYNTHHQRAPAPIPSVPQNGAYDDDDGSGPEDDYEWAASDFESSEEEDYENTQDTTPPIEIPKRTVPQPAPKKDKYKNQDDSDSVGSYEEPDLQNAPPPPTIPRRGPAPAPVEPSRPLPVNRRPIPKAPPEEQSVYEETNEDSDQPVYEDPEEQAPQNKKTARKQLPVPEPEVKTNLMQRHTPVRTTSEPDAPAPPPPRGGKQTPKGNKLAEEPSTAAPVPPPPRGGGRKQQPPPEPETQDFYEDPDNTTQDNSTQDVYEDPDASPVKTSTVRNSALPPIPMEVHAMPSPQVPEIQEVYEDPDAKPSLPPNRTRTALPPTPKSSNQPPKPPNTKKAPPVIQETEQLEYEVPDEILKGEMPQDDYMEMQPSPEEQKPIKKRIKGGIPILPLNGEQTMQPPKPGKKKQLPSPPADKSTAQSTDNNKMNVPPVDKSTFQSSDKVKKQGHRSVPVPVDKTVALEDQIWYHGDVERDVADHKLMGVGTNGSYLIRRSKKGGQTKPYTLAIFYSGQVFNLNIRRKSNSKYALGMEKPDEQEFIDLMELVNFFTTHRLILAKGQTRLKNACPK